MSELDSGVGDGGKDLSGTEGAAVGIPTRVVACKRGMPDVEWRGRSMR